MHPPCFLMKVIPVSVGKTLVSMWLMGSLLGNNHVAGAVLFPVWICLISGMAQQCTWMFHNHSSLLNTYTTQSRVVPGSLWALIPRFGGYLFWSLSTAAKTLNACAPNLGKGHILAHGKWLPHACTCYILLFPDPTATELIAIFLQQAEVAASTAREIRKDGNSDVKLDGTPGKPKSYIVKSLSMHVCSNI